MMGPSWGGLWIWPGPSTLGHPRIPRQGHSCRQRPQSTWVGGEGSQEGGSSFPSLPLAVTDPATS